MNLYITFIVYIIKRMRVRQVYTKAKKGSRVVTYDLCCFFFKDEHDLISG